MIFSTHIILQHLPVITPWIEMAFLQKLLKRKTVNKKEKAEPHEPCMDEHVEKDANDDRSSTAAVLPNSDAESDDECQKDALHAEMKRQLKSMNRNEERRRRRRSDVMAMEAEIKELISMISRCQLQCKALDEEILNKKCEIKFLQSEGPDDHEMHLQVKKSQPLMYKKYNNIKGSNEAKNLLNVIRQSQRALQYLELMTYNRYLERQHGIHFDPIGKRTSLLLKDKAKNFGHLVDAIHSKKLALKRTEISENRESNQSTGTTQVTVTSSPMSTMPPTSFGFPLMTMAQNSTANATKTNTVGSGQLLFPVSPLETTL